MIYKKIISSLTILVVLSLSKSLPENDTITNKLNPIPSTYREMLSLYHSPLCISLIDNRSISKYKENLQDSYVFYLPKIETEIEKQEENRIIQYHILPTLERILPLLEE